MPGKLSELYQATENLKGRKLLVVLVAVIFGFLLAGMFIGYFIPQNLSENEINRDYENTPTGINVSESQQFSGKVVYVDPNFYPEDDISYFLEDEQGNEIILLTAKDEKLSVVEGLKVIVYGDIKQTKDQTEDIFVVDKVIVKNN